MAVFNDLPTELRLQIFQCAVKNAEGRCFPSTCCLPGRLCHNSITLALIYWLFAPYLPVLLLREVMLTAKSSIARAKWVLAIKNSYRVMVGGFDTNPPTQEEIRKEALGGLSVCKERQEEVKEFVKKELA